MNFNSKIYVAGHNGLVGSAIIRSLRKQGYTNIIFEDHNKLNLINQQETREFFEKKHPEYVFLAAAKVGGIEANRSCPAEFLYKNLMINANVIHAAHEIRVKKLMILGSSCIYPKNIEQPMKETAFLDGVPEPTNEGYAIGKIAALELAHFYCLQYGDPFISCMPTNIYGENDNFDLNASHVIPAMIRKFHDAKINKSEKVTLWGSGNPQREFLYVDDLAEACIFLMKNYKGNRHINIGTGEEVSIKALAALIASVVNYEGKIEYDKSKPDGNLRKLLDSSKIHELGWHHKISLKEGIQKSYEFFLKTYANNI